MNRPLVLLLASLGVASVSRQAHADDAPPCAAEAEAVKKMSKRDPALGYPTDADALEHLEKGRRAFGVQEYDLAIEEYTAAGLADAAPLILYNLGQTFRAAKDYQKAIRQYQLFLERGKPGKEVRALVECHIDTMTAELEHAASTAPPSGPLPEPAGEPAPAKDGSATTESEPVPIDEPADGPRSRWTATRRVSLGVGALGVATVAAGIVFGIQANGLKDDAAELCPSEPCADAERANAFADKADTRATLANVSFGVGAGMIAAAVVLWYVGAPSDASETVTASRRLRILPHLTSDAATLEVTLPF